MFAPPFRSIAPIAGRLLLLAFFLAMPMVSEVSLASDAPRIPLIDVTDLYHPYQDPGDNFDLIAAYALPEIDLRAVILDATQAVRQPSRPKIDPGFIPVIQLNYIFDRNIPYGVSPFGRMKSPDDKLLDAPEFQQSGIRLILETLRTSREKVHIVSFGSARAIAAAFNRDPGLFSEKVARIYLSAGGAPKELLEWNITLDPNAIVCLLRSNLPIDIYPCSSPNTQNPKADGPAYVHGSHNTYWSLPNLRFVASMDPQLRRYLLYAFTRACRSDFLGALDDPGMDPSKGDFSTGHHVWETAVWQGITGRKLVSRSGAGYRLLTDTKPGDKVIAESLRPCSVKVEDDGFYTWDFDKPSSNFRLYERQDPQADEQALREALPALYQSFKSKVR